MTIPGFTADLTLKRASQIHRNGEFKHAVGLSGTTPYTTGCVLVALRRPQPPPCHEDYEMYCDADGQNCELVFYLHCPGAPFGGAGGEGHQFRPFMTID